MGAESILQCFLLYSGQGQDFLGGRVCEICVVKAGGGEEKLNLRSKESMAVEGDMVRKGKEKGRVIPEAAA